MRLSSLLCATLLPAAALAQDNTPVILDPLTLQAGLSPIEAQAYGRANTVITATELQARGITQVRDALQGVPGLAVSSAGASNTQIRIRGGEGNHTLVLIDGIRAAAGDAEYFLSGLSTDNIARIEVLRGPQSVFFGADASSGVINIITRPAEPGRQARMAAEYGNGWAVSGFAGVRTDQGGLSFAAHQRRDRGWDISATPGGDDDGIRRRGWEMAGDHRLGETITAGFRLRDAHEEYGWDATNWMAATAEDYVIDSPDITIRNESAGQIWLEAETMDGRLSHRLSYDQTRFRTADNDGPARRARTDLAKYRAIWGIDGPVADATQTLAFGLERRRDENSTAPDQHRRSNSAIIEYRGAFANGVDVQLGLRHDDNDVFRDATTWSAALSWRIPDSGLRLHASAGTGVVNPTYTELFGGWGTIGNPDLRPEENRGIDIGIEATTPDGRAVVDLTFFREDLENEITYSFMPRADGSNYYNQTGTSKRRGAELSGRWQATDDLTLGASYSYLHARDPGGAVEVRRPRHMLALSAEYLFAEGRGTLSGDLRHVSGNFDTRPFGDYSTAELPAYTVVDIAAGYDLTDRVRIHGRVSNLFDKDYADVWGYPAQGRAAWLGLAATW
ncbi:MAG: TonB-dependent receptor [Paracoccus sp. (in: a-proteobacteria)]|nr:TonB-dependent receptor [Paracoccus sp. (in: a-proteobacteria)]